MGNGQEQEEHHEERHSLGVAWLVGERSQSAEGHELCGEGQGDSPRDQDHQQAHAEHGGEPDHERLHADGVMRERHLQQAVDEPLVEEEGRAVKDRHVVVDSLSPQEIPDAHHQVSLVVVEQEPGE